MAEKHDHEHEPEEPAAAEEHEGHDHAHDEHDHDHEGHDHDHDHEGHDHEGPGPEELAEHARRRAIMQIRQYPDVALRLQANEIHKFDSDLATLVERMQNLMFDAQGVGLAATQLGILQRVLVFVPGDEGPEAVINPRLVDPSKDKETEEEGCLSLQGVRVPVERSVKVVLEGQDPAGRDIRFELEGLAARVAQHEVDHLDGVLIIERTDDESRKQALGVLRRQPVLR